jgi:HEPN/Toprim N-terminal domain 1
MKAMVSSCELRFDDISILSQKAHVPDAFIYLFQENDRTVISEMVGDETCETVAYIASREVVLRRLDFAGYTSQRAEKDFNSWLQEEQETFRSYAKDSSGWAIPALTAIEKLTYAEWKVRARDVLLTRYDFERPRRECIDEIDRNMRDSFSESWLFYGDNIFSTLRSMLEALPDIHDVVLDIGDLINAGWIDPDDRICEIRRAPNAYGRSILEPAVIITEGSTDIIVLKRGLQRIYPHLTDYITFFDYEGSSVDGGASYLVKFLRAFAAARISTLIVAVFDNDAVGLEALKTASQLSLPENIRVTKYPDIDLARAYPTIGPQGMSEMDINGQAVSIELFLGCHNISDEEGRLFPVVWSNYVSSVKRYQGNIQDKRSALENFLKDTEFHDSNIDYSGRFPEMVALWEHIFTFIR